MTAENVVKMIYGRLTEISQKAILIISSMECIGLVYSDELRSYFKTHNPNQKTEYLFKPASTLAEIKEISETPIFAVIILSPLKEDKKENFWDWIKKIQKDNQNDFLGIYMQNNVKTDQIETKRVLFTPSNHYEVQMIAQVLLDDIENNNFSYSTKKEKD